LTFTETYFIAQKDTMIRHKLNNLDNLLPYGELGKDHKIDPFVAAAMILLLVENCNRGFFNYGPRAGFPYYNIIT